MNINKVSQSIASQAPEFLKTDYPLFNKFIEYYYRSQEKTGMGQNIINNFLQYLDIDKLDINILGGTTKVVEAITAESDEIVVESVDTFLDKNGSILIGDEVIYYESSTSSPNVALSPGVSYEQVKLKWIGLAQIINSFDGTTVRFPLTSQSSPVSPPTAQHLIVSLYGEVLIPGVDYTVDEDNIVFTTAPRVRELGDDTSLTSITFLNGFLENNIVAIDDISPDFGDSKTNFTIRRSGVKYEPVADEYILAVYDNKLLEPKKDFFIDSDIFIFDEAPLNGRLLSLYSIEAPIPSFGSGAIGYARVSNDGKLTSVEISKTGSGYEYKYPPRVSISSASGDGASASALVNGVKDSILLDGGRGYSDTNPPTVVIQAPTSSGSVQAELKAVVTNGQVSSVDITNSGSGYTFIPRVSFVQPGGAKLGTATLSSTSVAGTIEVLDGGQGYTTPPEVYIDEPLGDNPVKANLRSVLTDGKVTSIVIDNGGQGYLTTPRIAIIDPTSAQVLETVVDSDGRITSIEILSGGLGYDDVPSVYIVDNREDGGTGAAATASVFNGKITDINISNFGSGYSSSNPPSIIIQNPPEARSSVQIGLNEVTGFTVSKQGTGYSKAKFEGCARAVSGIVEYTASGNAVFSNNTTAAVAAENAEVKCLDALFVKRLLDKYTEQFLPDVPELDYTKIDVRNAIKSVKDFYSTKGTSFSIAYLFKLLYGEQVTVSYPKDQIIKPSNATWSIDTILRATLVSGDPTNIKDGLLTQELSIADANIGAASALIENYISIKTSDVELFELVLSEETIDGTFVVPYKTKLAEPLDTTDSIITVDSTIGWPERNGEFLIGDSELIQYKEKSLNQFIECTRSVNNIIEDWDSATEVTSNLLVYVNKGTAQEVVLSVVGIVDAQQTSLTDTGSYYLKGDKLTVSKLGGTSVAPELTTWLYNVKKLIEVESITYGGVNNRFATVTCKNNHGLLVGDQVTLYGANPILFNGTFLVRSRDSALVFQYQLPQPAEVVPQGNILVSVDLNKGKSDNTAVLNSIGPYTTNIQNSFFGNDYVYVASTGIPNYSIGPFPGSALLPGNQRKLNRFPLNPQTISVKNDITPGAIGTWINGTSVWSYKSDITKTFGPVTSIGITNAGSDYDASNPPKIEITGGSGTGATAAVTVNGSITEIVVTDGGSGYTSSPLVSIVGGGGSGAAATAIVTKGVVSSILMNTNGTGYTSQPSITIVGGGGNGATATASVRGPVKSVAITDGGESYTSNPTVSLNSGSGAVAQAIVNNGRIISIAIISAGSGYTTAPEVTIQGDGFGAVARANIDLDGENAGRVTSVEIINRGINYIQGTTVINLTSVGSNATFTPNVFKWTYNLQETTTVDSAKGSVFAGYNNQYGGEYAHISNPQRLRYILGDNLFEQVGTGNILEQEDQLEHSPIIGWAFDGNPIFGPYGYSDPTDQSSTIAKLNTSFKLKTNLVFDASTNPTPVRTAGPLLSEEPAGKFIEDYEYSFGLGDLDQYNGRFCKTPDFPSGRYCYFITIDNSDAGLAQFPYVLGPTFNSIVDSWNLNKDAIQQNIPTGVVRYRDPYENVDIDVERAPNQSTNAITTEDGDILLFDIEDENKDGVISQEETDDPDQLFEESPLQLFDYFPKVKFDSKVDIEVETTTKFEDASVTGFTVEDAGTSYQVDDILVFDNADTDGSGVSARISKITGESVSAYTFETVEDKFYGVLTTSNPHNIVPGDSVFVDYTPVMDATNKTFNVRQFKGIEQITIDQAGSGYDSEIPPTIVIDGDGESGELRANVTTTGAINVVDIINSGSGYTKNPRVILSHPQVYKRADYYVSLVRHENYVKINDVVVNDLKEVFFCGKTLDAGGLEVAFVAKFSELGVKEWEKTIESTAGVNYTEFIKLDVSGNNVWVVGQNKPNIISLSAYNPDIILCKYVQAADGLSATLSFQKGYAGISGSTRSDNITTIKKYSDTRYIIGGYTNTNSSNPQDAFIASIDSAGSFAAKRKLASASGSEKITDLIVLSDAVYFIMETSATDGAADSKLAFGKALVGTSEITIEWIKEIDNAAYSFRDTSLVVDEFDEFYITSTLALKTDNNIKDGFWVGKIDTSGDLIWNYRYSVTSGNSIELASRSTIDIFGDLNLAFTKTNTTTNLKTVDTVRISYDGKLKKHTNTAFNQKNIEGITANAITVDNSGDPYIFGQTQWNRNEFLFDFTTGGNQTTDITGHYTPNILQAGDSVRFLADYAFIQGYQTASPSTWENAAIKIPAATLGATLANDWTLEFMLYKNGSEYQSHSQTQYTLLNIGDATDATGGLWLYYDDSSGKLELVVTNSATAINSAGGALQSTLTTMYANNSWQFIAVKKDANVFTVYVNGISVLTGSIANTSLGGKDIHIGNIPGKGGTGAQFRKNEQFQGYIDNLRLKNRAVTPTVPSDVTTLPPIASYALAYDWTDDAWFTNYLERYDNIDYVGFGLKSDKDSDSDRLGDKGLQTNTQIGFVRTAITPVTGATLTVTNTTFALGSSGLQGLDFEDATINMTENTEALAYTNDEWSSRTATVPSPGSKKLKISAEINNRYYMKTTNTLKIDNIQELTLNQDFNITIGSKLVLNNTAGSFVNSGYVLREDTTNNKVYLAVNNNAWSNDLNTGRLSTAQFDESSSYGIVGPIPYDVNVITDYNFIDKINTTPGTFDFDLADYNLDTTAATTGNGNLDEYATFKPFAVADYKVKIVEITGTSSFIPGSVVDITASDISFNTAKSTAQITNLTGVTKITLISTLDKILQVTAVSNTDEVYVITSDRHYFSVGDNINIDGNPNQELGGTVYDEYDGSFVIDTVVSNKEFTYKLDAVAVTDPATTAGNVNIFAKSPVLKMYYGHQYLFDVSHSSMLGTNLSFSRDNLYKLEYSFNSIERVGTPGVTGQGQPNPTIKLKVDKGIVTNISYYFDPSRTGTDSPIDSNSYLDIVDSPYLGIFNITSTAGGTITQGPNIFKFLLSNEPEGNANIITTTYTTSSKKAVGSIGDIRLINSGGFYSKLPIVTGIQSSRKIERIEIEEPGTEYAPGVYNSVPISGDGEGGFVQITVADGEDEEGTTIPGQIQVVDITSPGKGYTTASIDIESIEGILGSGLTGSGAVINVVIPAFGTGAVIFAKGTNVGKIKKLKNNNFGYDYTHDYTLRPEITFPINAQLTSTSILDSITVTDPGSGYSQSPAVILTGGGGSGAIAEATIRNGRIESIIIKDPGAGYSSSPTVELRSSFNYVVNLDLGLLQFAFPHGIVNGSEVNLNVVDTGEGVEFPLSSGATGRLNGNTTYYAITGTANSLEPDQMKLAITASNAELGDGLAFVNAGTGRQQVLTKAFGAAADANVVTSTFLEGELVYQGSSLSSATATGYVSTNNGWQIGPRVLKIVNYDNTFTKGESITGVISKSSGIISDLNIAKGVLEIGPITKTTGQFIDDVGKPSEIIQKIQDSYYYQDFSYAVKSSVSIGDWKDILIKNVHPASFKVFGELNLEDYGYIANKEIDFELTKSVELTREAVVPNIQNFALAEPIYSEFNNTEVLFRQKRLTSSENILTSVVQRLDDISGQFDGIKTQFPLTVNNGENVIASGDQLLIVLNGVAQTPNTSFEVQGDSIVFAEPPRPPASVKYVSVTIAAQATKDFELSFTSGIFPNIGNSLVGVVSTARLTVTSVSGNIISGFVTQGTFIIGENCQVGATGFSGTLSSVTDVTSTGLYLFNEKVTNLSGDTAKVETSNLETGQETPVAKLRYSIGAATTDIELVAITDAGGAVPAGSFTLNDDYQIGSEIVTVTQVVNGSDSTTITVTRGVSGTAQVSQQENTPIYSTEISVTNYLTLSKTTGTYQSTPGLYDIQLNDYIIGAKSGVVAKITATSAYQDPITNEFIEQVDISEGSSFFGLLFNRLASISYPNKVLDNISESQVSIVDFTDNITAFDSSFPPSEGISNNILIYDNESGNFTDEEFIRNYKVDYGGNSGGEFGNSDKININKLTFKDSVGSGFLSRGQVIRTTDTKAEIVGYNSSQKTAFLGKIGRSSYDGNDYHTAKFVGSSQLNTNNKKYGTACLALSPGASAHTFVSGVTNAIIASNGATGAFTAATGTTYNPFTGDMVIEIGTHTLTTSNKVTILDSGVVFTCAQDGNTANKAYPRATDPSSGLALTITAETDTTITVNVGAVAIDGYLTVPTSTEFGFGTGAFTIECWIKLNTIAAGSKTIFDMRSGATELAPYLYVDGANIKYFNNGAVTITGASNLVVGTWYHVAISRSGTDTKLFLNGTQEGGSYSDSSNYGSTKPIRIGGDYAGSAITTGYVDDLRVSNTARYTTTFTAPVGVLQGDADAKLLIHFDGTDGQTYTEDWSGGESLTTGEEFNNDSILETTRAIGRHTYDGGTSSNAITITAGSVNKDVTDATYDYETGELVLTIGSHSFTTSDTLTIGANKLSFTCTLDNNATSHTYPRTTDPAYGTTLAISAVTGTTVTVNVGIASKGFAKKTHRYLDAADLILNNSDFIKKEVVYSMRQRYPELVILGTRYTPTDATYDAATGLLSMTVDGNSLTNGGTLTPSGATYTATTGVMTLTKLNHGLKNGQRVNIKVGGVTFTCTMDSGATNHSYPRATDPTVGKWIPISNVTDHTFDVNIGASPQVTYTPTTGTTYDPNTGLMVLEIGAHNLTAGTSVKLAPNSLTFSCGFGGASGPAAEKTYPRSNGNDPFYNTSINIESVTATTITLQVLTTIPSTNTDAHTFVSATSGAVITGGNYTHTFVSALTDGFTVEGDRVKINDGALSFTCSMDNNQSTKTYPRATDPASKQVALPIISSSTTNLTVNVGTSPLVNFKPTAASYTPATGVFVMTIPNHTINVGTQLRLTPNSFTFTCDYNSDGNTTQKTYPRASGADGTAGGASNNTGVADAAYNTSLDVTAVGTTTQDVSTASYDHATGILTINTASAHNLASGNRVQIADNSLTFSCAFGGAGVHTYVGGTAAGAISVTGAGNKDVTGATYDPGTGVLVLTSVGHGLTTSNTIKIAANSLDFTCDKDQHGSTHSYPRATDPIYNLAQAITAVTTDTISINVGVATAGKSYPRQTDPISGKWVEVTIVDSDTFTLDIGKSINASTHAFVSATAGAIIKQTGTVTINVGTSSDTSTHNFVSAADNAVVTGGNYTHKFVSAVTGGVIADAGVNCEDDIRDSLNAIVQDLRNGSNSHIWDAASYYVDRTLTPVQIAQIEPAVKETLFAYEKVDDMLEYIITNTLWTVQGDHGLTQKTDTTITDSTYPAGVHAFVSGVTNAITAGGGASGTFTAASGTTYDPATGDMVLEIGSHSLTTSNTVIIDNGGVTFTCDADDNTLETAYPRASDPASGTSLAITAETATTITVNVGKAVPTFTPTSATYNAATGDMVLTIGSHSLTTSDSIGIKTGGIKFKCQMDGNTAEKSYPRATDPAANAVLPITAVGGTTHTITDGAYNPTTGVMTLTIPNHGFEAGDHIKMDDNSITFSCAFGGASGPAAQKSYPRSTDPISNKWAQITNLTQNTFDIQVLGSTPSTNTDAHTFVSAVADGLTHQDGTITVNVGVSPAKDQYIHTFASATSGAVKVLSFTTGDCADVYSTIGNLIDILTDTITNASAATPIDHLATISKLQPIVEFQGGIIDALNKVELDISYHDSATNVLYTPRIDPSSQDRFRDAANLLLENNSVIVDKAAFDMIDRYPDLSNDMPRNADGSGNGTLRCKTDLGLVVEGIAKDIQYGGNKNTLRAAKFYVDNKNEIQHIRLQLPQSIYAHERLAHYMKQAVSGDLDYNNTDNIITGDWGITNDTPGAQFNVSAATYDVASGDLTMNIGTHQVPAGRMIQLATNSLSFSCTYGSGNHTYVGGIVKYANTGDHTFVTGAENAIAAGGLNFTAQAGTNYDPTTGKMEIFIGTHTLTTDNAATIANNGITFTCTKDGNASNHAYPRATDPASGKTLTITAVTATSITVNVGIANALMVTGADTFHTYNGGTSTNAITVSGGSQFDVLGAEYDPLSGQLDMTIGSHSLAAPTTHTAEAGSAYNPTTGVMTLKVSGHNFSNGDLVYLDDGAITFSCTYGAGNHNYTGGPAIGAVSGGGNVFNVTDADYTPTTGVMVLTIGAHSLTTSDTVTIAAGSLDFQCDMDNYGSTHSYPRTTDPSYNTEIAITAVGTDTITVNVGVSSPGTAYPRANDPISNKWIAISGVTTDTFDIQVLDVTPSTNTDTHTFVSGAAGAIKRAVTRVTIGQDKLSFTCAMDGNTATKTYPRATDPVYNTAIAVSAVTAERITVNVGQSSGFVISDVDYNPTTGDMEMTIGNHALTTSNTVTIAPDVLAFTCDADNHQTTHTYPRTTDPSYNTAIAISGVTATTITVNVGAASGGQTKTYPRSTGVDYAYQRDLKILSSTADTITVNVTDGKPTSIDSPHTFVSAIANCVTVPGDCANVKDAIDTLITTVNDIIAPTGSDYDIGGNRLYFNRDYITQEIAGKQSSLGLLGTELQYTIDSGSYAASTYDYSDYRTYIEEFIIAAISDLQTGGNNSVITQMEKFLDATKKITPVGDELYAFFFAHELIKTLSEKAIKNLLYSSNTSVSGQQYAATHTNIDAYRDTETPTDIDKVWYRMRDLIDFGLDTLFPGDIEARSVVKNILYNKNYYKAEITSLVTSQFGSNTWLYNSFIDDVVNNIQYDYITSNTVDTQTAYTLDFSAVSGSFVVGETITNNSTTAIVLYTSGSKMVIGSVIGTLYTAGANLTAPGSGATATIATGGITAAHEWYNNFSNVKTIENAKDSVSSLIQGSVNNTNLWVNPEVFDQNWATSLLTVTGNAAISPDSTLTSEKLVVAASAGEHKIERTYTLTSFDTFDVDTIKWDSSTETFDTGANSAAQTFTSSFFAKQGENQQIRFTLFLDSGIENAQFSVNLNTGEVGSLFATSGMNVSAHGSIPLGDGWYRLYMTVDFGYGFSTVKNRISVLSNTGLLDWTGTGGTGLYLWGAKLTTKALGTYVSVLGTEFYTNAEYNIKTFALDLLREYMKQALNNTLVSPSPSASFYPFYDTASAAYYNTDTAMTLIGSSLDIISGQLKDNEHYTTITGNNALPTLTKFYGDIVVPVGISGEIVQSDYAYSVTSDVSAEIQQLTLNEAKVAKVYKRFRIDGNITDGPFTMNESVQKQGDSGITGVVYGFHEDANYSYLDVAVTAGTWQVTDVIQGAANTTLAQISAIDSRMHLINVKGNFVENVAFQGFTSNKTAEPVSYTINSAAVLDNTGGKLTVDTASLLGSLETTSVVYPNSSKIYLDVKKFNGFDVKVGDKVASTGHVRLTVTVDSTLNTFTVGNRLYRIVNDGQDDDNYGIITEYDSVNNYIYYVPVEGTIGSSDTVGDYSTTNVTLVGKATVSGDLSVAGAASARIQEIRDVSINKRLYLTNVNGTFSARDGLRGGDNYRSASIGKKVLKARTKRFFKGFDGTQTTFNLTTANGQQYLPDPEGHMMVFVNGILQPPGAGNAYTAFSDKIQFSEAPELGASFTGFYLGKLRQLDDIGFEFDSLRQSFNLKRDDIFYSLTLTDGVQSSTIRPENNIIISVNGVLQEPGVGFELVGSRIIFSEVPRFGSTFVGFSYVGSEADVDADVVVPPVEAGDFIDIEGEVSDREVAVIESSNSLITFDYLGSVFGQNANATAVLTSGYIERVSVTSGGSGYTSRPVVRLDSISGFEGQVKALVGIAGVTVTNVGSGYQDPGVDVETTVPSDWTPPDLSLYGEELVDPEIL
jgi:hypothetical protein